jgi:hypothetical protein
MSLSLVVPCYNEEATVEIYYNTVLELESKMGVELEFCFVDDGSKDSTLSILKKLHDKDPRVHYISFSRNFGKEAGIYAGLELATGDLVAVMDVDLQDPPFLLIDMLEILNDSEQNYDCVATRRSTRKGEPFLRSCFARLFYKIINKISDVEIIDGARDFRMMKKQVAEAIIKDKEYNRFSKGIYSWVGFKTRWISYENIERSAGTTKWSFWKLFRYSVEGFLAYSTLPLTIVSVIGVVMCGFAFLALLFIVFRAFFIGDPVAGWPSLVSIIIFIGGLILLNLGIVGLYISKIYLETKKRQIYIVKEKA